MSDKEIIGQTGAVTGFETPDPKAGDPTAIYTTTPAPDRVSSSDQSGYTPLPEVDPGAVTHQFDSLATRNVVAMEQAPQAPEYAGSQAVPAVSGAVLEGLVATGDLSGAAAGQLLAADLNLAAADPNPGYTPPSQMTPPHIPETPAGLPEAEPENIQAEVRGNGNLG